MMAISRKLCLIFFKVSIKYLISIVSVKHNIKFASVSITKTLFSGKYNEWKTPDDVQYSQHQCTSVNDTNQYATCKSCTVVGGVWQTL
jgi:hypothetical protein